MCHQHFFRSLLNVCDESVQWKSSDSDFQESYNTTRLVSPHSPQLFHMWFSHSCSQNIHLILIKDKTWAHITLTAMSPQSLVRARVVSSNANEGCGWPKLASSICTVTRLDCNGCGPGLHTQGCFMRLDQQRCASIQQPHTYTHTLTLTPTHPGHHVEPRT